MIRNILFHFIFLSALITLPNLGLWQLDRLEWKNELLNNISSRQSAGNITFPYNERIKDFEYRNTSVEGKFIENTQTFFFRPNLSGQSGYNVVSAFKTIDDSVIYIDIGWIPFEQKENMGFLDIDYNKNFSLKGILISSKQRNMFSPENDYIKNIWYTLSSTEMNQFYKLNGSFFILKIIDQNYFEQTLIEFNPTQIPNNHLQYAGTWFLLFIVVGVLYFYQVYQIIRIKWNT